MENEIVVILFDVDGVILKKRKTYFLKKMAKNLKTTDVISFFRKDYPEIEIGEKSLEKVVGRYLDKVDWDISVKELLDYWFSYENEKVPGMLNIVKKLKDQGYKCYIASDHSRYRAHDLMENEGFKKYFDKAFWSGHIGYTKENPKFFDHVLNELEIKPKKILFIDDKKTNVEVAESMGINTIRFTTKKEFFKKLSKYIDISNIKN
jgi:putative hydrolase of the HAD superfamily